MAEEGEIEESQEPESAAKVVFKEVEIEQSLQDVLTDTNVIEFPTLYV